MVDDSMSEIVRVPWLSRIVTAGKGLVAGLLIIPIAGLVLIGNEVRSVTRYRQLNEAQQRVVTVPGTNRQAQYEGRLVHLTGQVRPTEILVDPELGIYAEALKLQRVAEMYQWEERSETQETKNLGGGKTVSKTYTYHKVWYDQVLASRHFNQYPGHENPETMPVESETFIARPMALGDFALGEALVAKISQYNPLALSSTAGLPHHLKNELRLYQGAFYRSQNPEHPRIGDLRISFRAVPPGLYSVMARQAGSNLEPYQLSSGGPFALLEPGNFSADALNQMAHHSNQRETWLYRGLGFLVMFIGLKLLAGPLEIVAAVIPVMGRIVGGLSFLMSLLVAAFLSLLIIGVTWVLFRPLVGAGLLVGALVFLMLVRRFRAVALQNAKIRL